MTYKKHTFDICLRKDGHIKKREVTGYAFTWEDPQLPLNIYRNGEGWVVTDPHTGLQVCTGSTRDKAVARLEGLESTVLKIYNSDSYGKFLEEFENAERVVE